MARVIHTGQALVDEVVVVEALPERGGNAMASSFTRHAAGSVNILLAAARMGVTCVQAGALGAGPNADLIAAALASEGVTAPGPRVQSLDSGICVVMVEPSGERTFVTTQGAERHLLSAHLEAARPGAGDVVCVTGYSLAIASTREPLLDWLEVLDEGVLVVLDPGAAFAGLAADVRTRMLAVTDVWTSNLDEARDLTRETGEPDMAALATAVAGLLPAHTVTIVRDGPRGCAVLEPAFPTDRGTTTSEYGGRCSPITVAGFPQEPLDTNGAGDCHTGVLVAEVARGTSWVEAARRANAAAAIKVTRRGPTSAATRAEVDAFLAAG